MKPFEFDRNNQQWDRYRQFHHRNCHFVEFDDGSLTYTGTAPTPDRRVNHCKYGIQIVGTTDKECPPLYMRSGQREPVKKAWLASNGIQYLAVDHNEGVAVRIGRFMRAACIPVAPKNKLDATVYWPKSGVMPVTNAQIDVSTVDRELTNKLKEKLKDVRTAVTAIVRINSDKYRTYWGEKVSPLARWADMSVEGIVADITTGTQSPSYASNVAKCGFTTPRRVEKFDYLFI